MNITEHVISMQYSDDSVRLYKNTSTQSVEVTITRSINSSGETIRLSNEEVEKLIHHLNEVKK